MKEQKEYITAYSIKVFFAWYDLWVGIFIDKPKKLIYFCPIPCLVIRFKYGYLNTWP